MRKLVKILPEAVGLAYLQQLGAISLHTDKRIRRGCFKRCIQILHLLDLLPANFVWEYLTLGVDKNGDGIILIEGTNKVTRPVVEKTD